MKSNRVSLLVSLSAVGAFVSCGVGAQQPHHWNQHHHHRGQIFVPQLVIPAPVMVPAPIFVSPTVVLPAYGGYSYYSYEYQSRSSQVITYEDAPVRIYESHPACGHLPAFYRGYYALRWVQDGYGGWKPVCRAVTY